MKFCNDILPNFSDIFLVYMYMLHTQSSFTVVLSRMQPQLF